jgi:hypothetical protein
METHNTKSLFLAYKHHKTIDFSEWECFFFFLQLLSHCHDMYLLRTFHPKKVVTIWWIVVLVILKNIIEILQIPCGLFKKQIIGSPVACSGLVAVRKPAQEHTVIVDPRIVFNVMIPSLVVNYKVYFFLFTLNDSLDPSKQCMQRVAVPFLSTGRSPSSIIVGFGGTSIGGDCSGNFISDNCSNRSSILLDNNL